MQESTFRKIVGDPDFDPYVVLEEALVEYIKHHPSEVAKDRVALKWLVKDVSVIGDILDAVDINDVELIPVVLETIKQVSWDYSRNAFAQRVIDKLEKAHPDNVAMLLDIIKDKAPTTRLGSYPQKFVEKLKDEQIDSLVMSAVQAGSEGWRADDWRMAVRTANGLDVFINALKQDKVGLNGSILPLISHCATIVTTDAHKEVLLGLFANLNSYVCFSCGRGMTGEENDIIKSLSGYTLHRANCDPDNEHLSPDEIINGKPKVLAFPCSKCGEVFSTASGLSLHYKACR